MIADLDTLLIARYVDLTDRIVPSAGLSQPGPGKPPEVSDAELVCLAVAQVLLRYDDERHWLRPATARVGRLDAWTPGRLDAWSAGAVSRPEACGRYCPAG